MVEEFSEVREPGVLLVGQRFRWLIKEASPGGGPMLLKGGGWSADSPIPEGSAGHLGEGEGPP